MQNMRERERENEYRRVFHSHHHHHDVILYLCDVLGHDLERWR